MRLLAQFRLVLVVGHEAHFDQNAGNFGGLQHRESGVAGRAREHFDRVGQILDHVLLEMGRIDPRLPPHEAGEDARDLRRHPLEAGTAVAVGAVLADGEGGALPVGGRGRERIDAGAPHRVVGHGIGMHGNEEVGRRARGRSRRDPQAG